MFYLLLQILLYLILAAVVGFFIGWLSRGFGFESRLISSENQWRTKHHVLQSENTRLKSELDQLHDTTKNDINTDTVQSYALPFKSAENATKQKTTINDNPAGNHPLERLRSKLTLIEEADDKLVENAAPGLPPIRRDPPVGDIDDLKKISGIGPKIEAILHDLGIYHFQQIAEFSADNIRWVNEHLQFKGRIEREKWLEQAREIIASQAKK